MVVRTSRKHYSMKYKRTNWMRTAKQTNCPGWSWLKHHTTIWLISKFSTTRLPPLHLSMQYTSISEMTIFEDASVIQCLRFWTAGAKGLGFKFPLAHMHVKICFSGLYAWCGWFIDRVESWVRWHGFNSQFPMRVFEFNCEITVQSYVRTHVLYLTKLSISLGLVNWYQKFVGVIMPMW